MEEPERTAPYPRWVRHALGGVRHRATVLLIVTTSSIAVVLLTVSSVMRVVEGHPFRWYDWVQLSSLAWFVAWNFWQWLAVRWVDRQDTWQWQTLHAALQVCAALRLPIARPGPSGAADLHVIAWHQSYTTRRTQTGHIQAHGSRCMHATPSHRRPWGVPATGAWVDSRRGHQWQGGRGHGVGGRGR
jgi:hypothetical protein